MKINIKQIDHNYHLQAVNEEGNTLDMDATKEIGGNGKGMRPTQLLLAALGGCSAIDVISILKKQRQSIKSLEIEVDAEKEQIEEYSLFRNYVLHFIISGEVDPIKAQKAIQLSLDKYCSVSKTLEATAEISFKLTVNGKSI